MNKQNSILKFVFIFILVFAPFIIFSSCSNFKTKQSENINVLLLATKNYGLNTFLLLDQFDRYGWHITYTGVSDTITACPPVHQGGVPPILPDVLVPQITDITNYDAVVVPPGSGSFYEVPNAFDDLIESSEALELIKSAVQNNIPVYATCSGVRVLAAADVLKGKSVVGALKFQSEYEAAGATYLGKDHPPSIDRNLITTARGLYYSIVNSQAVATAIENNQSRGSKKFNAKNSIFSHNADFMDQDITWAKTYGSPRADGAEAFIETTDGGFLIVGYSFSQGTGDADMLVIKTDSDGNLIWSKIFSGRGTEYAYGCTAEKDGYLITGYTTSFGAGSKDVYVVKIDFNGEEIWSKTYGGSGWDVGTAVCAASDGGYYVAGFTHSFGMGEEDVYLIKIDDDGNELWSKYYGGNRSEMANNIAVTDDGNLIISASTGTFGKGNCDFYLIKTDADGNELWAKPYGNQGRRGYGFDWCTSMCVTSDNGYVLAGYSDVSDIQNAHAFKIDADGSEIWSQSFGKTPFYDYGNAVAKTQNGNFIIAGITKLLARDNRVYNNDIYLIAVDANGNKLSEKSFGGPKKDWCSSALITTAGDIAILGHTNSTGAGSFDVCLLKILDAPSMQIKN